MKNRLIYTLTLLIVMGSFSYAQQTTIGGYGELHMTKPVSRPGDSKDALSGQFDFHRFVLFVSHQYNDWVSFESELEVEHTQVKGGRSGSEVSIEQAYVNLKYSESIGLRAGILLVPVGILNEVHEPPTFNGVERTNVEKVLIPTTWRDAGIGIFGRLGENMNYRVYLMAGLNPSGVNSKGVRDARQSGFFSSTNTMALTGRLEYTPFLDLKTGFSFFTSSLNDGLNFGTSLEGARFNLIEADFIYSMENLQFKGLGLYSAVSESAKLQTVFNTNPGAAQAGGYLEASLDLLRFLNPDTDQQVRAFGRVEYYNTHVDVPENVIENESLSVTEYLFGLTYLPINQVVLKADLQFQKYGGINDTDQTLNLGVGYYF